MTPVRCFAVLVVTTLAGTVLGAAACAALELEFVDPEAWLALGSGAVLAAGLGAFALYYMLPAPRRPARPEPFRQATPSQAQATQAPAAPAPSEANRKLRHDLRGALSPALLTADRLLTHADPAVQRAADIMVRAVEKAAALLADPPPGANPPGRS